MRKILVFWMTTVFLFSVSGCDTSKIDKRENDIAIKGTVLFDEKDISENINLQREYAIELLQTFDKSDVMRLIAQIKREKSVKEVFFHKDTGNIDIVFQNGMLGGIIAPFDRRRVKGGESERSDTSTFHQSRALNNIYLQNQKVLALDLQYWEWGDRDDIPQITTLLNSDGSFEVEQKFQKRLSGDLEVFTKLDEYGIVLLSSHGATYKKRDKEIVIINTNTEATSSNNKKYNRYISEQSVIPMQLFFDKSSTKECSKEQPENCVLRTVYHITPEFIEKYNRNFQNTVIYMSICKGAANNSMANAFLKRGASVYLGYSDNVAVSFTVTQGRAVFQKLLSLDENHTYKNIQQSFISGIKERDDDPAEFKKYSYTDLIAIKNIDDDTDLVDGDDYVGGVSGIYESTYHQYDEEYEIEDIDSIDDISDDWWSYDDQTANLNGLEEVFTDYSNDFDGMDASDDYFGWNDLEYVNISGSNVGETSNGEILYDRHCASCHGTYGEKFALGKSQQLNTMSKFLLIDALSDYKSGLRDIYGLGRLMKGQVNFLSDAELQDIASYIITL